MAGSALTERAFERLTGELSTILTEAQNASSSEKLAGYWHVGERITGERLSEDAGYHNTVLREIALRLGVSQRTLQHAVLFHSVYPAPPEGPLSWAHYRLLAPLPDKPERTFYTKRSLEEGWTIRELKGAIGADLYRAVDEPEAPKLERPVGAGYVYRAKAPRLVDADTLDLDVDLGFQTWTRRRIRLANIDAHEAGTPEGRAAKNYVLKQLSRAQTLVVKTEKLDLHGRYVADLFLSPHLVPIDDCYRSGTHLNSLLLKAGHAKIVY